MHQAHGPTRTRLLIAATLMAVACSFATPASAAEMRAGGGSGTVAFGGTFEAVVTLDTQDAVINAVQGTLTYPADVLEPAAVTDEGSAIDFWIVSPRAGSDGRIAFSGIAPGGFQGDNVRIFTVVFRPLKEGQASIGLSGAEALYNDGKGTPAPLSLKPFDVSIAASQGTQASLTPPAPETTLAVSEDTTRPDPFTPKVSRNANVYGNRWFVAFAAQDKQSGIDHYEISETPQSMLPGYAQWVEAQSPYLLKDQSLKSRIGVKAVDRNGNVRITVLSPAMPTPWYGTSYLWLILAVLFAPLFLWGAGPRFSRGKRG